MFLIAEGSSMFNPDRPIKYLNEDQLNRQNFAISIGEAILKNQTKDRLVIGLLGGWGSGKTSLANMVIDHIRNSTISESTGESIIFMFNPLNFSEQNQLLSQFFNQLSFTLKRPDYSSKLNTASDLLKTVSKILKPITVFPTLSAVASTCSEVVFSVAEATESVGKCLEKDLNETKKEISDILENQNMKIIILIDDIDRLNDREIRQVFQLVKSLADFPNTVYLLTFDRNVVVKAIEKDQLGRGEEYLDKIIQVPIDVPLISKYEIERILYGHLRKLIESDVAVSFDQDHWNSVYNSGFKHFFKNIRDVTRYINLLKFYFEIVKEEVDLVDFFGITAIQVFIPHVYQRINENKHIFTGAIEGLTDDDKIMYKDVCDSIIDSSGESNKIFLKDFLSALFPNLWNIYMGVEFDGFDSMWRIKRRICSSEFFELYFKFSLSEGLISQAEIHSILSLNNPIMLSKRLIELGESKNISVFLSIILDYVDQIQKENIESIVTVLLDFGALFPENELPFHVTYEEIHCCVNTLLKKLEDQEERFNVLRNSFEKSTKSLAILVEELSYLLLLRERDFNPESYIPIEKLIINPNNLEKLEDIVREKINNAARTGGLDTNRNIINILFRWKLLGAEKKDIDDVISRIMASDDKLIGLITNCSLPPVDSMVDYTDAYNAHIMTFIKEFMDLEKVEYRVNEIYFSKRMKYKSIREKKVVKLFLDNIKGEKKIDKKI